MHSASMLTQAPCCAWGNNSQPGMAKSRVNPKGCTQDACNNPPKKNDAIGFDLPITPGRRR